MQQEYRQKFDQYKKEFEDQILEQRKKHRLEIESMKKIQQKLKSAQDRHLEDLRKTYNELTIQKENNFNRRVQQLLISHQKEIKEKEKLIMIYKRIRKNLRSKQFMKQEQQ